MNKLTLTTVAALLLAPLAGLHAADTLSPARLPAAEAPASAAEKQSQKASSPVVAPVMQPVDITQLQAGSKRLDLFLLMGQSNMRGRGKLPAEQKRDPRIVMMHVMNDQWYLAQESLHFSGDPVTMTGDDKSGVGPGLSFAKARIAHEPDATIGLIPCAVGGSRISLWSKSGGKSLYDKAVSRAKLALENGPRGKTRICGVLWLQGESDAKDDSLPNYNEQLLKLVDNLRAVFQQPDLPFIACTIGNFPRKSADEEKQRSEINKILLDLPTQRPYTACVDARDLKDGHRGDNMHYNSEAQVIIGQRFEEKYLELFRTGEAAR